MTLASYNTPSCVVMQNWWILIFVYFLGHVDYKYPIVGETEVDVEKQLGERWSRIVQKSLNPKCRQLRLKRNEMTLS